jgi:hypothetical protein
MWGQPPRLSAERSSAGVFAIVEGVFAVVEEALSFRASQSECDGESRNLLF